MSVADLRNINFNHCCISLALSVRVLMFKRHRRKLFILITFIIIIRTLTLTLSVYPTHSHTYTYKHLNGWHFSSMIASLSTKQKQTVGIKEEKPSSYCLLRVFFVFVFVAIVVLVENAQKIFLIYIFASLWVCSTAFINNHCWLRSTNKDYTSKSGSPLYSFGEFLCGWMKDKTQGFGYFLNLHGIAMAFTRTHTAGRCVCLSWKYQMYWRYILGVGMTERAIERERELWSWKLTWMLNL